MTHADHMLPIDPALDTLLTRILGSGGLSAAQSHRHYERLGLTSGAASVTLPTTDSPISPDDPGAEQTISSARYGDSLRNRLELVTVVAVMLIVLAGVVVYQTAFSGGDGDVPVSGPGASPSVVATDTQPTSTATEEPDASAMQRGLSFEEAQEITSFELIRPDPLPEGLEFIGADVRLASDTTPFDEAYLMYRLVDGEMPDEPIIFKQSNALLRVTHWTATEKEIGSRTVTTFHTAIGDDGVPLAVYAWTEDDVLGRSYMVSVRLAGDVTEQHLEDLIAALPE